jgi:hypothetical protein
VAKIGIDQLSEGMIVEESVGDFHGTILMQKGTAITRNGIKILKMWGVIEVSINDESAINHQRTQEHLIDPSFLEEAKSHVTKLFQHTNQKNLFVIELQRLTVNRIAKARAEKAKDAE